MLPKKRCVFTHMWFGLWTRVGQVLKICTKLPLGYKFGLRFYNHGSQKKNSNPFFFLGWVFLGLSVLVLMN